MASRIKRTLSEVKMRLHNLLSARPTKKIASKPNTVRFSSPVEPIEQRRKEALEHLVKKYFETKRREEELRRKLESYGKVKRWLYEKRIGAMQTLSFLRDAVVKPVFLGIFGLSGVFSAILATSIMPSAALFISSIIPFPLDYPVVILLAVCIAFSPFIVSMELYRHFEMKREKKRIREEYGIIV